MEDEEEMEVKPTEIVKIEIEEIDESPEHTDTETPKSKKRKVVENVPVRKSQRKRIANRYYACLKKETKKPSKKAFYYVQKFRKEWLEEKELQPWLVEVEGDVTKGYCIWCQKEIHARYHEIKRHGASKKHLSLLDQFKMDTITPKRSLRISAQKKTVKKRKDDILELLKDISTITEGISDEETPPVYVQDEKENQQNFNVLDMAAMVKEQEEKTSLLNAFLTVQQERLQLDRMSLEHARHRVSIHQSMLEALNSKSTEANYIQIIM